MCKRDWERQKGEGARVSANECVSELATRAAGRRRGCRCGCRLRLTKVLGVGSSDLAWFGLGTDNQGEEGKEGEEGRKPLAAPAPASAPAKQMQMQILIQDGNQDGRERAGGCEWAV